MWASVNGGGALACAKCEKSGMSVSAMSGRTTAAAVEDDASPACDSTFGTYAGYTTAARSPDGSMEERARALTAEAAMAGAVEM